ncbi:phosphonoacetaldehyde reductase [Actinoplanes sp. NPDC048967]|uniref:phosphonoacetaldehyde reductase n=1 Tax=Actinoplanes sp. NPDC048967 TaxID=3155269 RepID=UPI0033EB5F35
MTPTGAAAHELLFTRDAAGALRAAVDALEARRVLLVGSGSGLARSGLSPALAGREISVFTGFRPNPDLDDVLAGCRLAHRERPDVIVGIGGGSAMDTAKLVRGLPPDRERAIAALSGDETAGPDIRIPLLLLPTTAGTGSEVTQFATVYVNGRKHSLDRPQVHADISIVDPALSATCPAEVTFSCAFDALAHALESLWSLRSTAESRRLAARAARGISELLQPGLRRWEPASRERMSLLAIDAGLAINRTRTTVGHAVAYPLTVRFGVPHGLACLLALAALLPAACASLDEACADPRGAGFVGRRLAEMAELLGSDQPAGLGATLSSMVRSAGFDHRLRAYGVGLDQLDAIVADALGTARADNTPITLDRPTVREALRKAW